VEWTLFCLGFGTIGAVCLFRHRVLFWDSLKKAAAEIDRGHSESTTASFASKRGNRRALTSTLQFPDIGVIFAMLLETAGNRFPLAPTRKLAISHRLRVLPIDRFAQNI